MNDFFLTSIKRLIDNIFMDNNLTKKERIIEAALELFAKKGFDGTSIRDISKFAEVNVSMISYYFGSKQGLYKAIIQNLLDNQIKYINKFYNHEIFEKSSIEEKAKIFMAILDKMADFLYGQMSDNLLSFLIREQQNISTAFIPPVIIFIRKMLSSILQKDENSREIVYLTLFLISQFNSPRIINVFIRPYGQGKFEKEDIDFIKNNAQNYAKMIFKNAGINL